MKALRHTLSRADLLAESPSLNIGEREKVQTALGGIISIIAHCFFIYCLVFIVMDFVRTDNPDIIHEASAGINYPAIDVVKDNHLPVLFLFLDRVYPVESTEVNKYISITFRSTTYSATKKNAQGQAQFIDKIVKDYPVLPCKTLLQRKNKEEYLKGNSGILAELIENHGMCIDTGSEPIIVQGRANEEVYSTVNYEIYPCSLDTSKCATQDDLNRVGIIMTTSSPNVNLTNFKNPVTYAASADDFYLMNPSTTQRYMNKLSSTQILDERGFLLGESTRTKFTQVENTIASSFDRNRSIIRCVPQDLVFDRCYPYFMFEMMSGGNIVSIRRKFGTLLSTVGDIGGVKEFIYLLSFLVYAWYNNMAKKHQLVKSVFKIYDPKHRKSWRACGCLKKNKEFNPKYPINQAEPEVIDRAYDIIKKSLDVVTIAKEIGTVRFMAHFLLKDYHRVLIPLVALNIGLNKQEAFKQMKKEAALRRLDTVNCLSVSDDIPLKSRLTLSRHLRKDIKDRSLNKAYRELEEGVRTYQINNNQEQSSTAMVERRKFKEELHSEIDLSCHEILTTAAYLPFPRLLSSTVISTGRNRRNSLLGSGFIAPGHSVPLAHIKATTEGISLIPSKISNLTKVFPSEESKLGDGDHTGRNIQNRTESIISNRSISRKRNSTNGAFRDAIFGHISAITGK